MTRVLITGAAGGIGSAAAAELDVLINNAGVGTPQSAGLAPDDRALAVIDVNLVRPWRVTRRGTAGAALLARARRQRRLRPGAPRAAVRHHVLHE